MAGDWIKMRIDLQSHPKIVRILSATGSDKFRVIGGLHAVWAVFDTHSEDGVLPGYTADALDHVIGWAGFGGALLAVGWLVEKPGEGLVMPEFGEHNGQSAKRRAEDQKRKRESRSGPKPVRNLSAEDMDEKWTREEKRREDIKPTSTNVLVVDEGSSDQKTIKVPRSAKPNCPHLEIIELYHELLPASPGIKDWTPARAATLKARWDEDVSRQDLSWWRRFFGYVAKSDFLTGRTHGNDKKPFTPGLEWLCKAENFTKIREGRYHQDGR